ncbi:HD domain-containing protein [Desulfurispira natronophila]|uniref:Poly(A) polymerase n=1 Tax=Desulfurispira natronophila TaxID=682562 RepID=A0A7W7Y618_9BACT|nr:HD domain-containing protein [Desulfurispira natronophila]MBB5022718.1 poly(A) polymerase [Desulfurispira natronophila]
MTASLLRLSEETLLKSIWNIANHTFPGCQIRLTGGWVRDRLRGVPSNDIDLILWQANPQQFASSILQHFPGSMHPMEPAPDKSRKVEAVKLYLYTPGEERFELDLMQITHGSNFHEALQGDALRRDFTINALFYDYQYQCIDDPTRGLDDLNQQQLRLTGNNPLRLQEDPLRLLRLARFHAQLGFNIEKQTRTAMECPTTISLLRQVSTERIGQELWQISSQDGTSAALELLFECGALDTLLTMALGEVNLAPWDIDQMTPHHHLSLWQHSLMALKCMEKKVSNSSDLQKRSALLLAALLHDIGKRCPWLWQNNERGHRTYYGHEHASATMTETFLRHYHFPQSFCARVKALVKSHMLPASLAQAKDKTLRNFLRKAVQEELDWHDTFALCYCDIVSKGKSPEETSMILTQLTKLEQRVSIVERHCHEIGRPPQQPLFNGHAIMKIFSNHTPGPWIGEVQQALLEIQDEQPAIETSHAAALLRESFPAYVAP